MLMCQKKKKNGSYILELSIIFVVVDMLVKKCDSCTFLCNVYQRCKLRLLIGLQHHFWFFVFIWSCFLDINVSCIWIRELKNIVQMCYIKIFSCFFKIILVVFFNVLYSCFNWICFDIVVMQNQILIQGLQILAGCRSN